MTIIEVLKDKDGVRLSTGNKWLVFDRALKMWVVYKASRGVGKIVIAAQTEEEAVEELLN